MASGLAELPHVAFLVARIFAEVLMRGELLGVDEDGGDDPVGALQAFVTSCVWPEWMAPMVGTTA